MQLMRRIHRVSNSDPNTLRIQLRAHEEEIMRYSYVAFIRLEQFEVVFFEEC